MDDRSKIFRCAVITPHGKRLACDAISAEVPAHDGQLGVLCHRAPLFCQLTLGWMKVTEIRKSGDTIDRIDHQLIIDRGFMLVADNSMTVIAYDAVTRDELGSDALAERVSQLDRRIQDVTRTADQRRHDEKEKALIERLAAAQGAH